MPLNTESLRKVLEHEQKTGCQDSAVFGGLDRFLLHWVEDNRSSINSPALLRQLRRLCIIEPEYATYSHEKRREWITIVLSSLTGAPNAEDKPLPEVKSLKPVPAARKVPKQVSRQAGQSLDSPVTTVKGISTALSAKFAKLGVTTVRDLLYFFPHRHLDYSQRKTISQIVPGEEQTIIANVWEARETLLGGRRSTEAILGDETGNIRAVWFNQSYLARMLKAGSRIVLSGKVGLFRGLPVFESPEWEIEDSDLTHTGRLVPVYPLTEGLRARPVRRLMKEVVEQWAGQVEDILPPDIKHRCGLLDLPEAISQAHYPQDEAGKNRARVRLAFDELMLLQLGVLGKKRDWQKDQPGSPLDKQSAIVPAFLGSLPFQLTPAQQKVLEEILADLQKPFPMTRLLQGDVGSGKTVVATAALLLSAANGYQGAFMAPTEVLAEQHFGSISALLSRAAQEEIAGPYRHNYSGLMSRPLSIALLVGDIRQSDKQDIRQLVLKGEVDIIIGTHALIQKGVEFHRLGLAVVDEQHRFGVEQRSVLRQKGFNPHVLAMTATPIPRTLALTLYGDLDLSVINQLPPGRQTIKTRWLKPEQRASAYAFLRGQIAEGHQAFIICPLIEESEAVQARAAIAEYEHLSTQVFSDLRLGLLHGRMSSAEKDGIMRRFRAGELDILVSTPVIEVGIDVPNATVMLVESADRFGLSQLHQFRGRVGRGQAQSYCMLLAQNPSELGRKRLDIIEKMQDGFQLAEEDLKLRGPGEFFGTRQSGLPDLRMARLSDTALLELARKEALALFQQDSYLSQPEHKLLSLALARVWQRTTGETS